MNELYQVPSFSPNLFTHILPNLHTKSKSNYQNWIYLLLSIRYPPNKRRKGSYVQLLWQYKALFICEGVWEYHIMSYLVSTRHIILSPYLVLELLQFLPNFTKLCKFKYVFSLKSLIKIKLNTYSFGKDLLIAAFCDCPFQLPFGVIEVQD